MNRGAGVPSVVDPTDLSDRTISEQRLWNSVWPLLVERFTQRRGRVRDHAVGVLIRARNISHCRRRIFIFFGTAASVQAANANRVSEDALVEQSEAVLDMLEFAQETGSAAFSSFELEVRACANIIHPVRCLSWP